MATIAMRRRKTKVACDAGSSSGSCCSWRLANHGAATCSRCFVCTGCSDGWSWSSSVSVSPTTPAESDAQNCGASATTCAVCDARRVGDGTADEYTLRQPPSGPRHANGLPSSAAPKVAVRRQMRSKARPRMRASDAFRWKSAKSISCGATSFTSPAKVSSS